jgi:uncharacterized protein YlxW (UPF0749 family)
MLLRIQEIQEINSAYQGIKNENNKLRQQIHDYEKKADQQQRNQSHMNDELKGRYIKLTQIFFITPQSSSNSVCHLKL